MQKITTMLLMMFLALGASNCTSYTTGVVCNQIADNSMKALPSADISLQFARCRARCLDPNTWQALELKRCIAHFPDAKPGEMSRNYPLAQCEGLSGFFVEDIATEIRPKMKALNAIKNDYCN